MLHINKTIRKEIMKRSRLKNKTNKSGKEEEKRLYNIQRNKVSKLTNKLKKTYFKEKLLKGNNVKDFSNYCKPSFTNKSICNDDRIILVENDLKKLNKDSDILKPSVIILLTLQKIWVYSTWLMTPWTVRIFSPKCLVSVTILVSKLLRRNIKIPLILNLNLLVLTKS